VVAINTLENNSAPWPNKSDFSTEKKCIELILSRIWNYLRFPPRDAWLSTEGKGNIPQDLNEDEKLEEEWSRSVTEMLLFIPYNGPGQTYLGSYNFDEDVLKLLARDDDPAYPIVSACQQLCSMAAISRGFDLKEYFNSGGDGYHNKVMNDLIYMQTNSKNEEQTPGKWYSAKQYPLLEQARNAYQTVEKDSNVKFGPGSVYVYSDKNKGSSKGASHIAFIVRGERTKGKFQFFDTSAMNSPAPERPWPYAAGALDRIYDFAWVESVQTAGSRVYDGLGVLPVHKEALKKGLLRIRKARPLGFARLVLQERGSNNENNVNDKILFASPLLPMHYGDLNFPISRLMWSLRSLPGRNDVNARWIVYVPQNKVAKEMIYNSKRDTTVKEILESAYKRTNQAPPNILSDIDAKCILIVSNIPDKSMTGSKTNPPLKKYDHGLVGIESIDKLGYSNIPRSRNLFNLPWNSHGGTVNFTKEELVQKWPFFSGDWIFTEQEVNNIKQRWQSEGAYSIVKTNEIRQTASYAKWNKLANEALERFTSESKVEDMKTWIRQYESHESWKLDQENPEPPDPGENPEPPDPGENPEPPDPGTTPGELSSATVNRRRNGRVVEIVVGNAPMPAYRKVKDYNVTLPGNEGVYTFRDNPVRSNYKYFTTDTGIAKSGRKIKDRQNIDDLFDAAGLTEATVKKVMKKVSAEEGGFEGVNTYDTGYISIGCFQFTSQKKGNGSLGDVLREMKRIDPKSFKRYFHDMGIDVSDHDLIAINLSNGQVLRGEEAVATIIDDKRLTAVFYNVGLKDRSFWVSQLKTGYKQYYIAVQKFEVKEGDVTISGEYGDVLKSEAGKTAIMDFGVQRGVSSAKDKFRRKCAELIRIYNINTLEELAKYEVEIIPEVKNRIDILTDPELSQPTPVTN